MLNFLDSNLSHLNLLIPSLSAEEQNVISKLELIYIISDRFSHSIRTHLGISMGIIEDLDQGLLLERQDILDAKNSLKAILHTLECLRETANPPDLAIEEVELEEFFRIEASHSYGLAVSERASLKITNNLLGAGFRCLVARILLTRALRLVFRYLAGHQKRTNSICLQDIEISLTVAAHKNSAVDLVIVSRYHGHLTNNPDLLAAKTLTNAAKVDHCPEALGLIFAEEVFKLHRWHSSFFYQQNGNILIEIKISIDSNSHC